MTHKILAQIVAFREGLYPELSTPFQLTEPAQVLDLASRRGDRTRTFKYLHQMCNGHAKHLIASSKVKQLFVLDGYVSMARMENPHGVYMFARTGLELVAFLNETSNRLRDASRLAESAWEDGGCKFFSTAIRSRFATKEPELRALLLEQGVSRKLLDPMQISHCIDALIAAPETEDAGDRYEVLCDFLHHNLGSATLANAGSSASRITRDARGNTYLTKNASGITQYEYPIAMKGRLAVERTSEGFIRDMQLCTQLVHSMPETPYTPQQILDFTGTTHGYGVPGPPQPASRPERPGRNDACPCGSGKKYKHCCMN